MTGGPPRFERSPHLVTLIAEAERLATAVAGVDAAARADLASRTADAATLASLRLDGAELPAPPDPATIAAARAALPPAAHGRAGTWFDAMGVHDQLDAEHTAQVRALEYAGTRAALDEADALAPAVTADPGRVLATLHAQLTDGLVAPERHGAARELDQAVHDAANGRVLFFAVDPARIPGEIAMLASWLTSAGAREHGLVAAGVVHHELLRIHPFDAANGRLARAAARLVLRHHGLDPAGLAAPEVALAQDPLAYHEEVARTVRRRDLTIWLERWGEAVTAGLRRAARALAVVAPDVPERAVRFLTDAPDRFTVADHRAACALGPADSAADLAALLDAGAIERVAGSRGLRFVVRERSA